MSRGEAFEFLILSWGKAFVHNDCAGGGFLSLSSRAPREGMVLDEIDSCITRNESIGVCENVRRVQ